MKTHIQYTSRTPNLATEKAFSTDFPVDHIEGAQDSNIEMDDRPITVTEISNPDHWKLDVNGFCFLRAKTTLDSDGAYSRRKEVEKDYWYQIEAILHKNFPQYSRIEAYDLTVRKRDPDFPEQSRTYVQYEQPAPLAHCDTSAGGASLVLRHSFPGQDDYWEGKDYDMINVWRPLRAATNDWPLAFCDYNTIDQENDLVLHDTIRRNMIGENSLLHFNTAHRWYYLKNQGTQDLVVFRNSDSFGKRARAFHAAVQNPDTTGPARESVEVRLVAFH